MTTLTKQATKQATPAAQETKCATCKHLYKFITTVDFCDQFEQDTLEKHGRYIVLSCTGYTPGAGGQEAA
jgi:hypothetical protein